MNHPAIILLLAFLLDLLIGDPPFRLHPVRLMGRLIERLEPSLRRSGLPLETGSWSLPVLTCVAVLAMYGGLHVLSGPFAWLLNLILVTLLIALNDLQKHARAVTEALERHDLATAQRAVQKIVGRDVQSLDRHGIARAAVESTAENFTDGFLSPLCWFTLGALGFQSTAGGVALLLVFKAISTLDSMVGYRNEKYRVLGRVSARLDDLMNFIPARLSIPTIALAARTLDEDARKAWETGWRDRLKHDSPNSAHAEAAVAGALGLRLGGPTVYPHGPVVKPWLGDGRVEAVPSDIRRTIALISTAALLVLAPALLLLHGLIAG